MQPAKAPLEIYTVQLARWRLVKSLGYTLLDVTAKSGNPFFAPSFDDVLAYKRGEMSEETYTKRYLARMSRSQREMPREWEKLKTLSGGVAVACYCRAGVFCHRHLFVNLLEDYLRKAEINFVHMVEITPTDDAPEIHPTHRSRRARTLPVA